MTSDMRDLISFWVGIFGILLALFGFWYSRYLARQSDRRKRLVLDVGPSVPLVSLIPESTGIKLSVAYEKKGAAPVQVQSLYLTFVRIGNLGREPIRAADIAAGDPLVLIVANSPLIDMATVETTRPVTDFQLGQVVGVPTANKSSSEMNAEIKFAFLDYQDGALIRVLTESASPSISLRGTIVGMPEGVDRKNYFEAGQSSGCWLYLYFPFFMIFSWLILPKISVWFHWHLNEVAIAFFGALFFVSVSVCFALVSVRRSVNMQYRGEWPQKLSLPYWFSSTWQRHQRDQHQD